MLLESGDNAHLDALPFFPVGAPPSDWGFFSQMGTQQHAKGREQMPMFAFPDEKIARAFALGTDTWCAGAQRRPGSRSLRVRVGPSSSPFEARAHALRARAPMQDCGRHDFYHLLASAGHSRPEEEPGDRGEGAHRFPRMTPCAPRRGEATRRRVSPECARVPRSWRWCRRCSRRSASTIRTRTSAGRCAPPFSLVSRLLSHPTLDTLFVPESR